MSEQSRASGETLVDRRALRTALGRYATGVTVITTCTDAGKREGLTANSFSSVSLDPPLVLWCLQRDGASAESFVSAGRFAVNVLGADQSDLSRHFAAPRLDKFDGVDHRPGLGGCPLLAGCLAHFECRTERTVEAGDHLIFIGRVVRSSHVEGDPLIYSAGRYCVARALTRAAA